MVRFLRFFNRPESGPLKGHTLMGSFAGPPVDRQNSTKSRDAASISSSLHGQLGSDPGVVTRFHTMKVSIFSN